MKPLITVQNTLAGRHIDVAAIRAAVEITLDLAPDSLIPVTGRSLAPGVTVVLTDDAHIRRLNAQYGDQDTATDVLAFPAGIPDPDTGSWYLGDIIVSLPHAARQAADAGHEFVHEVQLLVVHGTLHLLGLDHHQPEAQRRMWLIQEQALQILGNPARPPAVK